jgi:hypothetical protein
MRIAWMVACEKVLILSGPTVSFLNVYLDAVPWRGPEVGIPLSVFIALRPTDEQLPPQSLALRILTEDGIPMAQTSGQLPGVDPGRDGKAIIEGFVTIERPGRYQLEVLVEGIPLDDAPTWRLDFVATK